MGQYDRLGLKPSGAQKTSFFDTIIAFQPTTHYTGNAPALNGERLLLETLIGFSCVLH
jgi:hypothetical protein